eukprot:TRINITY_DN17432_c1_g2_i1.p1 TRINITY_DN17432_c1_g2~~TRINITY_DN17432_c1_g2_i1.p1  ORF type:complete len:520 (+),score=95.91 TRINITY_DN17432_c1_g2_i1:80-1561(+)
MLSCAVALLVVLTTSTVNVPTAEENVPKTPVPTREFSLKCVDVEVPTEIEPLEEKEGNAAIRKAVNDVRTQRVDGKGGGDRWGGTFGPVVVMTYAACHGAVSQHYGHLSAMTIASLTKPDVMVLPHGRTRKTYKSRNVLAKLNTTNSLQNASHDPRIEWTEIPLSRVYRLDTFQRLLGGNTTVLNSPNPPGPVTLPSNFSGYERYWVPGKNEKFGLNASIVEMRYKRRRSGWVWKEMINRAVLAHWRAQVVIVDLGCTDIMVSANPGKKYGMVMQEDIKLLKKAHQTLQLAPYLRRVGRAAMGAVRKIQPEGGKYTGLHLRMERDMFEDKSVTRWKNMYLRAKEYFLDDKKEHPLLIASGIFEYMKRDELRQHLLPYSNTHDLYHLCLSRPLDNDIRPWIDFQVLATADYFQGHDYSSLSWLVVQQRILHALPLSTSSLVRRVIPARSPLCCENDRCLSTVCPLPNGTLLDYGSIVTEVAYELPPAVLDIAVK